MSSRILVKNLPPYISEDALRERFSAKGEITDIKIAKTASGKSRQFGFIGYKSESEAEEAVKFFNKAFMDTQRLHVEIAKRIGDPSIPRSWSKHSKNKTGDKTGDKEDGDENKTKEQKMAEKKKKHLAAMGINPDDTQLTEFLQVMKSRGQMKTWENDDILPTESVETSDVPVTEIPSVRVQQSAEDDEYQDLPVLSKSEIETAEIVDDEEADKEDGKSESENIVAVEEPEEPASAQSEPEKDESAELLADTGRIFVRNLSYTTTEDDLRAAFEKFGPTSEVHIPIDVETKQSKGIAFVSFMIPEHAVKAYAELDGSIFQGRLLHLIASREKRVVEVPEGSSFKSKKAQKLKSQAGDEASWNSLFMSPDAVADSMATKLNVAKSDILDPHADNMAVRLALAETHVIEETVKYLEQEGVCIDAFKLNMKKERSDSILMVKNIPFQVSLSELMEMFKRHGDVLRLVLPPTRTVVLVEYTSANEAKAAFKNLAYKNFKGKPLLLEMAPLGVFNASAPKKPVAEEELKKDEDENSGESATLFVKNLSFTSTNKGLTSTFQVIDGFRSATITTRKDPKIGKTKSMGFGFIEFATVESAKRAMKTLQGVMLDDHALQLKFSDRGTSNTVSSKGKEIKAKGTKLLVRNVAFEATKKDIKDLFATFGQLKSVKLPKKFDNKTHRGFAFVDFLTKQEAKNAFENLASTHLYGRHLVIEWADDADNIEALREKTKRMYNALNTDVPNGSQKRIKLPDEEGKFNSDEDSE